jgi:hypothetical protein
MKSVRSIYLKKISLYPKDINISEICRGHSAAHPTSFNEAAKSTSLQNPHRPTAKNCSKLCPTNLNVNSSLNEEVNFPRPFSVEYGI